MHDLALFFVYPFSALEMTKGQAKKYRLSEEQEKTLRRIAKVCSVNDVDALRWAIDALGQYFDYHGQRLMLPLKFTEQFRVVTLEPSKHLFLEEPPRPAKSKSMLAGREP